MTVLNQIADLVQLDDRTISANRLFDAPRALVFKVWTDPQHIVQWWGPKGFTTTNLEWALRPGGIWRFVMHGPDGTDYPNKITFLEIVEPERLVYEQGGEAEFEAISFHSTVLFEAEGTKTRLRMKMRFPSNAARDHVIDNYGADKGLVEHLERLAEYLISKA